VSGRSEWLAFEFDLFRKNPREWLVLTGDRLIVGLLGLAAGALVFFGTVYAGLAPLRKETPVLFLVFALIGANFTLIAIVTSLSQLVLGRRLESPGEIRTKIDQTISYREDVGETIDRSVMPVKPDAFFLVLYENTRENLSVLADRTDEVPDGHTREQLAELTSGLQSHTVYVIDLLERPASGLKHAMFVSLNTDYENHVHRTWYLQTEHAEEFDEGVTEPLTKLTQTLEHIVVASRMFKTTFIEAELAELSRYLLYVGLPVQIAAVVVMLLYTEPGSSPPMPIPTLQFLVPTVVTAGFAPFFVLAAYVVRLTIVARRTADNFPFSSQLRSDLALGRGPRRED